MNEKLAISIVIPCYNEEESLPELVGWISRVINEMGLSFEIIIIDDGSKDGSWDVISSLSTSHPQLKAVRFSGNYGKSAALDTAFKLVAGKVVITMDADLQDSPDEIPALYRLITDEGYDLVSGWKKKRNDPISKTIPSKFFNYITRLFSGIKLHDFNCGLKAYNSKVVKRIEVYGEMHRYIPLIAKWQGFDKIGEKEVVHYPRKYGHTKFGWERFIYGFLDLISITFITRFIKRPMHFFGSLGTLSFLSGFFITIWLIGRKVYGIYNQIAVREVTEQPLFFLALVAVIVGMQLFLAGFLGELMLKHSARKTEYAVDEKIGL
jgi:glycosyltransferase involved in cell wall biosynthesis